jgi:rhodanese-related sulfurtransferase
VSARDSLAYAGEVTPREAHALSAAGAAKIVDIRTPEEWRFVGHVPDVAAHRVAEDGRARGVWKPSSAEFRSRFDPAETLLLICRSGVRSHYAAELLASAGFTRVYNVLEGFEGDMTAPTAGAPRAFPARAADSGPEAVDLQVAED